tara:strand:- start:1417 stop:2037 length:621 start_codon:yes stop_codon:yes gene_type:complete
MSLYLFSKNIKNDIDPIINAFNEQNIGKVVSHKFKKKNKLYNLTLYILFYNSKSGNYTYSEILNNKIVKILINNETIYFRMYKNKYQLNQEKQIKNLQSDINKLYYYIDEIRSIEGIQCGSCIETDHLLRDKEFPHQYYCRKCWREYYREESIKDKENKIYLNTQRLLKHYQDSTHQTIDNGYEIEDLYEENRELEDEIKILNNSK